MQKEEGLSNRRFSDLWVVSRGIGEKKKKKIDILYFVNRLLSRLLSPSILHTVLSSLQYPYTAHPKIINFRYPTDILSDSYLVWTMKHPPDIQRTTAATWVVFFKIF